jgi:hypothetical protein
MNTPYLDAAIKLHEKANDINMASDGAKEALLEFKAIKEALKQVKNIAHEPVLETVKCYTCNCTTGIKGKYNYCNMCDHYF